MISRWQQWKLRHPAVRALLFVGPLLIGAILAGTLGMTLRHRRPGWYLLSRILAGVIAFIGYSFILLKRFRNRKNRESTSNAGFTRSR